MIALIIVLAVLAAILLLKVGVDAAYGPGGPTVAVKVGPLRIRVLPRKAKAGARRTPKAKQAKPKRRGERPVFRELAKMILRALKRFRRRLCVERLEMRYIAASDDPYDTARQCACVSAALGALSPVARQIFRVRSSRVEVCTDFQAEKPQIRARLVLTLHIWEILYMAAAFGWEFLQYRRQHRKPRTPPATPSGGEQPAAQRA